MIMSTTLIVIQYGQFELVESMLDSLSVHEDRKIINEIIIVDNGKNLPSSEVEVLESKKPLPEVKIVQNEQSSYSSGVNKGANVAEGDVILISNNDIEWTEGESIAPLIRALESDSTGIAGPQLTYPDGSWQRSFGRVPSIRSAIRSILFIDTIRKQHQSLKAGTQWSGTRAASYVDGAFMAVRRSCFDQLGGFDERFDFYGEDADFCLRARTAGWNVVFEPSARITHIRGATSTQNEVEKYTLLLAKAKLQVVQKHEGETRMKVYFALLIFALFERAIIYTAISLLSRSQEWSERARNARTRLRGIVGSTN